MIELNEALMKMVMYCECPVFVEILLRDEHGCATWIKRIPIARIKPNFDRNGVAIQIEDGTVQTTAWKTREEFSHV